MTKPHDYVIHTDIRFGALETIDLQTLVDACTDDWTNQTLCQVNDCVVRLGVLKGEFHWHVHDVEDEFFFVVEGELLVDLPDDRSETLTQGMGILVSRGTLHRTRSPKGTVVLMVEGAGVVPTGN